MMKGISKILIANRGEIAVRIIRACHELNIPTVAIYSDKEKEALHVKMADESICIGPAPSAQSYLNIPAILSAAEITNATAIHPGYGFLAENANFAEACITSGITFIGPTPENIRIGGEKALARQTMKKKGIPVIPGSDGPVEDETAAYKSAKKCGYPAIIKASSGGGGRGMRIVNEEKDLKSAFHMAQREALTSFGNGELYLEKYLSNIRHIEVQILADDRGNVIHLGERNCSIQRRHQKLIEEAPYTFPHYKMRKKLCDYAVAAAKAIRFRNVGTVEFIVDENDKMYFMEINTRVQVEHPVTEMCTDFDIIKEQIKIAAGLPVTFKQQNIYFSGHSIECRINAEDSETFLPSSGKIITFIPPGGPGVRVDTAVYAGYTVPPYYDSLIAKVIVKDTNRENALKRMKRALKEFYITGIETTIPFHLRILQEPDFVSGNFNTNFLDKLLKR
jgi:acetyl-CoA carboxylase biotin carboxylase subunit